MVKIRNVFGNEYRGRQGDAVYQKFYGKQVRRLWDGKKKNTAPAQEEQKRRFKKGLDWWKSLSYEEKQGLERFLRKQGINLTGQQYAIKTALGRGRVSVSVNQVSTVKEVWKSDWDAIGWLYRQEITLANDNAYDLINYPVPLDLDETNVGENFDWDREGADLRFYDVNGNKLKYYVESWDRVNKTARVYVEVPLIQAAGTTTIKMYYNNPTAESESDITAKWFIYEDMSQPPAGTLKGVAYYDSANKRVVLTEATNGVWGALEYTDDFNSYYVEFQSWAGGGSGADATYFYAGGTATPDSEDAYINGYIFANDEYQDDLQIRYNDVMHKIDTAEVSNNYLDTKVKMIKKNDGTYLCEISNILGTLSETRTEIPQGNLLGVGGRTGGLNNWHVIYYLRVKRQAELEPAATFGAEEYGKFTTGAIETTTTLSITHSGINAVKVYDDQGNELVNESGLSNVKDGDIRTSYSIQLSGEVKIRRVEIESISGILNIIEL